MPLSFVGFFVDCLVAVIAQLPFEARLLDPLNRVVADCYAGLRGGVASRAAAAAVDYLRAPIEEDDREQLWPYVDAQADGPCAAIALLFSGEEQYGKYLDLYANHTAYNNLKHISKRPGYLQYLDILLGAQSVTVHSELPRECRISRDYELYVF